MPEMFTAFFASAGGNPDLAFGNIIGSNIGNIGLIMGVAAMVYPIRIQRRLINKEMPVLLASTLIFTAFCLTDYELSRYEGIILFCGMIGYLYFLSREAKNADAFEDLTEDIPEQLGSVFSSILFVALGGVLLAVGADLLVGSSIEVAYRLEVSPVLIGITVVAIGTSLPELGASLAAAMRKQSDICAGNIVGSNLFNLLFVGGGVSSVYPIRVESSLFQVEMPVMLLITALLWLIFITDRKVTRLEGAFLLILYVLVIALASMSHLNIFRI